MLWNDTYKTGVPVMDEQHRELFQQIDILLDSSKQDRIPSVLNFLGDYVVKHFSTEESLQAKSNYPKRAQHKQIHTDFIAAYKSLRSEYEKSGHNAVVLMKLTRTAMDWLKNHIRGEDREFATYYIAQQST